MINYLKFLIWDTAGQERFKSITKIYLKDVTCVILMYDISNIDSFENLKEWIKFINNNKKNNLKIILVGNKNDRKREVSIDNAKEFAKNNNFIFFETNSINSDNIDNIFNITIKEIFNNYKLYDIKKYNTNNNIFDNEKKYRYKYCCI